MHRLTWAVYRLMTACLCTCVYISKIEQLMYKSRSTVMMNEVCLEKMHVGAFASFVCLFHLEQSGLCCLF